mgnify:CR=1 FL=1
MKIYIPDPELLALALDDLETATEQFQETGSTRATKIKRSRQRLIRAAVCGQLCIPPCVSSALYRFSQSDACNPKNAETIENFKFLLSDLDNIEPSRFPRTWELAAQSDVYEQASIEAMNDCDDDCEFVDRGKAFLKMLKKRGIGEQVEKSNKLLYHADYRKAERHARLLEETLKVTYDRDACQAIHKELRELTMPELAFEIKLLFEIQKVGGILLTANEGYHYFAKGFIRAHLRPVQVELRRHYSLCLAIDHMKTKGTR